MRKALVLHDLISHCITCLFRLRALQCDWNVDGGKRAEEQQELDSVQFLWAIEVVVMIIVWMLVDAVILLM